LPPRRGHNPNENRGNCIALNRPLSTIHHPFPPPPSSFIHRLEKQQQQPPAPFTTTVTKESERHPAHKHTHTQANRVSSPEFRVSNQTSRIHFPNPNRISPRMDSDVEMDMESDNDGEYDDDYDYYNTGKIMIMWPY